ncbi:pleckstrin homology domain-containing family A member 7-like isoform X5 [Astatotilapia calliptera]|uniref:pleckstrin homology domain-containing family A member 7-like isoform X5 n=1 Tax=Astatotilapia calliptera TaxID=8154 RepID=UPI000E41F5D1|nr:pleckstrin homology domain-containing family A member 7-like isoform X5 [Astatotilapia calliptera]
MAAPLGRDTLPEHWSYGVCGDGRVFFINDETRTTTWLHPRSGQPVNSGHMIRSDLPCGWEEGFTDEGASYFINHNQRTTTFRHPVTGQISPENMDFILQPQGTRMMSKPAGEQLSSTTVSEASTAITSSTVDTSASKGSRSSGKVHSFGKREQSIKRNPNVPVVVRGWLYKQDSSGMRLWKRKWFVLADFCLFYYKDSREESVLGSIPLPSYVISPVGLEDHINRKYAFKAEHTGMRTYYFSADTQEDMNTWLRAMNQATLMQNHSDAMIRPADKLSQQAVPQTNHVSHHKTKTFDSETTRQMIHEVLLEPIHRDAEERCSFHKDSPATIMLDPPIGSTGLEMDTHTSLPSNPAPSAVPQPDHISASAPVSRVPSRAPSRAASTLPSSICTRNGLVSTPSPILEPNGIAAGTYQRAPEPPANNTQKHAQRRSTLEQVEQWVKVQKAEYKGAPSRENTLPRRTPPTQHKYTSIDAYQTLPKTPRQSPPPGRLGEYKYAQDRLSHFRLTPDQGGPASNTVWQLYEWQQRHQYRHGSPTAPLYTPAPEYPFGPRPPSTVPPSSSAPRSEGSPRCVSVPPSSADIPPPGPPPGISRTLSPARRPHTPAERVTVKPVSDISVLNIPFTVSPRRTKSQLFKAATVERRSMPPSGYITHTVSAPSLHGKTPEELTLLLIQLRRHQAKMASARQQTLAQLQRLNGPKDPFQHNHLFSATTTSTSPLLSAGPSPVSHVGHMGLSASLGPCNTQADDTYMQLKKDLEYLDLKIRALEPLILAVHSLLLHCTAGPLRPLMNVLKESGKPVKVAESDVDVKLSRLCEQDNILKDLEARISSLKDDKDKLESVLDLSHQQMEQYQEQPAHAHKIAYQQRLLQEDLVTIRAQISRVSTEMAHAWEEYSRLENSVDQLRLALQAQMNHSSTSQQEKAEMKRELWRIEDVMAGLSASKANYKITIDSVQNPERKLVPSVSEPAVPSPSAEIQPPPRSSIPNIHSYTLPHSTVPKWAEDSAPPRPPLPRQYDYEDIPPVVPPLPKEASVIRHTSVRGLKRQSDERKRDRESGQYVVNGDYKADLRSYLSEPELPGVNHHNIGSDTDYQYFSSKGSSSRQNQSNSSHLISSYVTLRRGLGSSAAKERPKSALECLSSTSEVLQPSSSQARGRMTAEEQLERMKRHQKALIRERKRNLSQGERSSTGLSASSVTAQRSSSSSRLPSSTSDPPASVFDWQEERPVAEGQSDEGWNPVKERGRIQSDEWVTVTATRIREVDVEPLDYDLDISRELSKPEKVLIPERYIESDTDEPLSPEELEERARRAERIKTLLAKSSVQNIQPSAPLDFTELDSALQQQERIMNVSQMLASEASRKSKLVAGTERLESCKSYCRPLIHRNDRCNKT